MYKNLNWWTISNLNTLHYQEYRLKSFESAVFGACIHGHDMNIYPATMATNFEHHRKKNIRNKQPIWAIQDGESVWGDIKIYINVMRSKYNKNLAPCSPRPQT